MAISNQVEKPIRVCGNTDTITIVLVDKRECMIVETKDDTKEDAYAAAILLAGRCQGILHLNGTSNIHTTVVQKILL